MTTPAEWQQEAHFRAVIQELEARTRLWDALTALVQQQLQGRPTT